MKKLFGFIMSFMVAIMLIGCQCSGNNQGATTGTGFTAATDSIAPIVVERVIAVDRQDMYMNTRENTQNYRWYETGVQLKDFLDEENDGSIDMVVNVFQAIEGDTLSFDTYVVKYQHFADGTTAKDAVHGFWIEDFPLNDEAIKITFEQAYERVMAVNMPKPHSRQVVLRKQVGPIDANPQWIFGNLKSQIYVDAVTGEVSAKNPAFPVQLGMPLGEWP